MSGLAGNLSLLKSQIPETVKLVAVSKTKPVSDILEAYNSGQRYFGENRVQEIIKKIDLLPDDIEWHFIGHLQGNKVKSILPFISMIQSIDTFKLLETVNNESLKINRLTNCLLQIHIATEETKSGFTMDELTKAIESPAFGSFKNINICGVMGMATYTPDIGQVKREFKYLANCFKTLKNKYFKNSFFFREISMGMSGDYTIALEEGSTMIRIGSLIFGDRSKT